MNFDSFSPLEVIEAVANTGVHKGHMRLEKVFFSAVSAGCLLSFACGTVLSTNSSPWFQENAPGLIRTICSLVFPYGLVMIILTGADLCTGSFMVSSLSGLLRLLADALLIHDSVYYRCCVATPTTLVEDAYPLGCDLLGKLGGLSVPGRNHLRLYVHLRC